MTTVYQFLETLNEEEKENLIMAIQKKEKSLDEVSERTVKALLNALTKKQDQGVNGLSPEAKDGNEEASPSAVPNVGSTQLQQDAEVEKEAPTDGKGREVPVVLLNNLVPPSLKGGSVQHYCAFFGEYKKYASDYKAQKGKANAGPPATMLQCIPSYRRWVLAGLIKCEVEDLTDEKLEAYFNEVRSNSEGMLEKIRKILSTVRMDCSAESCADSTADFVDRTAQKLESFGGFEVLDHEDESLNQEQKRQRRRWAQEAVKTLQKGLKPSQFQQTVSNTVENDKDRYGKNIREFMVLLSRCATNFDDTQSWIPQKKNHNHEDESGQGNGRGRGGGRGGRGRGRGGGPPRPSNGRGGGQPATKSDEGQTKDENRKRKFSDRSCYGCGKKGHGLFSCRDTPEAKRQKLIEEHKLRGPGKMPDSNPHSQHQANNSSDQCQSRRRTKAEKDKALICCKMSSGDNTSTGIDVLISNCSYKLKALLDNGSNCNLVPLKIIMKLIRNGANISLINLPTPHTITLGDKKTTVDLHKQCIVDITIQTPAGTLVVRRKPFYVWDVEDDEVILGEDLLNELGINPKAMLDEIIRKELAGAVPEDNDNIDDSTRPSLEFFEEGAAEVGADSEEELGKAMERLYQNVQEAGLRSPWDRKTKQLIRLRAKVWRRKLGANPPVNVPPFVTELKPGAEPVRCRARKYSEEESKFLKEFVDLLLRYGLIVENLDAKWASPVIVVRKPGNRGHRMVIDLREVNKLCVPTAWPMPHLETIVTYLANSKYWFLLDAFKGFWCMPVAEESQEMLSFMTDRGVYTPKRSVQGHINAASQFQARMCMMFDELLWDSLIIWIDDCLGHAPTIEKWYETLSKTLLIAEKYGLQFNIDRCDLFLTRAKFCGRILTPEGIEHDPTRIEALTSMEPPETAADLQQFLMALQWMSRHIPAFNELSKPLHELFENVMQKQPKRSKSCARAVQLGSLWTAEHQKSFDGLKAAVAAQVKLAFPKEGYVRLVFTDASDYSCAGMVTQVPIEDIGKRPKNMHHEPLGFVSHKFNGSEIGWTTAEKEGYGVKMTMTKLSYLLPPREEPCHVFTDHKNLIAIFSPEKWSKPQAQKLERWAQELQKFHYVIEHIAGAENHFADLLTRWGAPPNLFCRRLEHDDAKLHRVKAQLSTRVRPLQKDDFEWPSVDSIKASQRRNLPQKGNPRWTRNQDGLWCNTNGRVIIPQSDLHLRMRLVIIAHAGGHSGHVGQQVTLSLLRQHFTWPAIEKDVKSMCNECLHCLPVRGGKRIPRPLGSQVHGKHKNQVLHIDVLYIDSLNRGDSTMYHNYDCVLVIVDDWSGFTWLQPCHNMDAEQFVEALLEWRASFGTPEVIVTDRASYFKSKVVERCAKRLGMKQHFVVSYTHYPNGTVEVVNAHVLELLRALISELRWDTQDWPYLLTHIEHTINYRRSSHRSNYAPVELHTQNKPDNPLDSVICHPMKEDGLPMEALTSHEIQQAIERLQKSMKEMHKVTDKLEFNRERARAIANSKMPTRAELPNFEVGEFVLVGLKDDELLSIPKPKRRWQGPYKVTDVVSTHVFMVQDILTGVEQEVHVSKLRFYCDKFLNVDVTIKEQFAFDCERYEIREFKDERIGPKGKIEILCSWRGFGAEDDSWEPIDRLYKDVPNLVERHEVVNKTIEAQYREQLARTASSISL